MFHLIVIIQTIYHSFIEICHQVNMKVKIIYQLKSTWKTSYYSTLNRYPFLAPEKANQLSCVSGLYGLPSLLKVQGKSAIEATFKSHLSTKVRSLNPKEGPSYRLQLISLFSLWGTILNLLSSCSKKALFFMSWTKLFFTWSHL